MSMSQPGIDDVRLAQQSSQTESKFESRMMIRYRSTVLLQQLGTSNSCLNIWNDELNPKSLIYLPLKNLGRL